MSRARLDASRQISASVPETPDSNHTETLRSLQTETDLPSASGNEGKEVDEARSEHWKDGRDGAEDDFIKDDLVVQDLVRAVV